MDTTEIPKGTGVGKDLSAYLRVSCDSKDDTVLHSILRDPTCIRITRQVNDKENCEEVDVGVEVNVCAIVVVWIQGDSRLVPVGSSQVVNCDAIGLPEAVAGPKVVGTTPPKRNT